MSLVGPRPDPAYALTHYEAWIQGRLIEMYPLDVAYAAHASLLLDLRIPLRTIPVVLGRNGAA